MEFASTSLPSESGTENQLQDALVLVIRQQQHAHPGQTPASNFQTWRSNKVVAENESKYTAATKIALQPFDLDTFSIPMYNEGSSSLTPFGSSSV
jgi:hypothetical protein